MPKTTIKATKEENQRRDELEEIDLGTLGEVTGGWTCLDDGASSYAYSAPVSSYYWSNRYYGC